MQHINISNPKLTGWLKLETNFRVVVNCNPFLVCTIYQPYKLWLLSYWILWQRPTINGQSRFLYNLTNNFDIWVFECVTLWDYVMYQFANNSPCRSKIYSFHLNSGIMKLTLWYKFSQPSMLSVDYIRVFDNLLYNMNVHKVFPFFCRFESLSHNS